MRGFGGSGSERSLPYLTPISKAGRLHPGYHSAIPWPLLPSLRENRLCSIPITHKWEGGVSLSKTDTFFDKMCVTKAEYDERGKNICREKFDS